VEILLAKLKKQVRNGFSQQSRHSSSIPMYNEGYGVLASVVGVISFTSV